MAILCVKIGLIKRISPYRRPLRGREEKSMKKNKNYDIADRLNKTTTKKTKVVGTQKYINATTGEVEDMLVTQVKDADCNFTKVFMYALLPQLELIGNKKIAVCKWIIEHLDSKNTLLATIEDISEGANVSVRTVQTTVKQLVDCDFLRRKANGVYVINPEIMFKGSSGARANILLQYSTIDSDAASSTVKKLQLKELEKSAGRLNKRAEKLREEIRNLDIEDVVADEIKRQGSKKKTVSDAVEGSPQGPSEST